MGTKRKDIKYQLEQGYKLHIKYQLEQGYKLQTIMHYVNKETLKKQHEKQEEGKASGIDGMTKEKYGIHLERNIDNLLERMKKFSYHPKPVRKTYIPKANGNKEQWQMY